MTLVILLASCAAVCVFCLPSISSHLSSSSGHAAPLGDFVERALTPVADDADRTSPTFNEELQEIVEATGQGDTLSSLMMDNISDEAFSQKVAGYFAAIIRRQMNLPFDSHTALKPGIRYAINLDREGRFLKATVELDPANVFHVVQDAAGLRSWKDEMVLDFKQETLAFRMRGTLRASLMAAGESVELASKLSSVFRWDIDFQTEAARGDVCKVLFERRYADDRPSGYGRVLCAIYEGKKIGEGKKPGIKTAILFGNEYYDETGVELKKNFLRSPLSVIRVTSRFGTRFHPVLGDLRFHKGVDYGAPAGTPVWSVAGGEVIFAGVQNGYGNYVCIRHDNGYESRYAHLQKIFVRVGERLKQRQRIGLVGQTGMATGPHLCFQLLDNGTHVNPERKKMVQSLKTVAEPLKVRFSSVSNDRFLSLNHMVLVNSPDRLRKSAVD